MEVAEKVRHNKIAEMLKSTLSAEVGQATQEIYSYINMVHGNSDSGFISIFHKDSKSRWGVGNDSWSELTNLAEKEDMYASVNSFYSPVGCISSKTKKLNALFIDLDYYNVKQLKGLNAEEVIQVLRKEVDYPEPSIYIDSGNGLYLMWLLNNTYATTSSRAYWRKIEETLIRVFEPYGADTKVKDPARVLRIPGTINSKTGRMARVILPGIFDDDIISYSESPPRFELREIAEYFWGDKKETIKCEFKKKPKINNLKSIKTLLTLNYNRALDLERLVELRGNLEGSREYILFLYRLHLLYANIKPQEALELTLRLNSKLTSPLSDKEVIRATRSAETNAEVLNRLKSNYKEEYGALNAYLSNNGAYIYQTSTLIKDLKILIPEQKDMLVLIGSEVKKQRKSIRNAKAYKQKLEAQGKKSKKEELQIIRDKIKNLRLEGFANKEIMRMLGITSTTTFERHISYLKKNGLL
nr:hypothetical protein [uncultured Clostridium sp.]